MSFFASSKDRLIETMALPILNRSFLAPWGHALELHLDSTLKAAELLVELKGEQEPLRIRIAGYEFSELAGERFVTIRAVETSREWMTFLAERLLVGQPLKLPREFAGMISRLV